ncbi:hypothetical protein ACFVYC_21660 [Pseudarthrobacter sp. NPDC058329]|uniref:hypothetical protein n=1 Tax=Pseudarthrobacter sp. NPDC058329 TaxID=3346448 RepID=UPI0036DCBD8D
MRTRGRWFPGAALRSCKIGKPQGADELRAWRKGRGTNSLLFGAYKGREKTLTPERAAELVQRADSVSGKLPWPCGLRLSRETVYQYMRHAKLP